MDADRTYTVAQVATVARELRQAAGTGEEHFYGDQVIRLLSDEVRLLRERGFTNQQIADLLTGFDIDVTAEDVETNAPAEA